MSPSPPPPDPSSLMAVLRRELLVLGCALAFGLLAVPPLLWLAGRRALGPYAGGGMGDLFESFFRGLGNASFAFWTAALAPYLVALVGRALVGLARGLPAAD